MFCKNCGNEIKENEKFCTNCGEKIFNIKQLYNMLNNNRESLTSGEIEALIKDFQNKSTEKIELNNAGNYLVSFNDDTHFNGVLVYKPKKHLVQDFKVEQSKDNAIVYQIENDSKILAVNAEISKYDLTKKPDIINDPNFNDNKKKSPLNIIGNIFWMIFTGFWSAVAYALIGVIFCITIIGIPFGLQYFKFAKLMLMPFGAAIVDTQKEE